jgi:hypothetical protein
MDADLNGANVPAARYRLFWTGTEMIVWGGTSQLRLTGGRYDPSTDMDRHPMGGVPLPRSCILPFDGGEMLGAVE